MGFNITELRTLRKSSSDEKYTPEGSSSTSAPEYTPTPKATQPMETEQSSELPMDIDLTQDVEVQQSVTEPMETGAGSSSVSRGTLSAIGLDPGKWTQLLELNKKQSEAFPQLPPPSAVSEGSTIPKLPTVSEGTTIPTDGSSLRLLPPLPTPIVVSEGTTIPTGSSSIPAFPSLPAVTSQPETFVAESSVQSSQSQGATAFPEEELLTTESVAVSSDSQPLIITVTAEMAIKSITKIDERFICPFVSCRKSYAHKLDCNKHVKDHFKAKETFKCDVCNAEMSSAKSLLEHTHGVHIKGDYLYKCEKCGAGFYYNSHFSVHKRSCTVQQISENQTEKE